MNDLEYHAHQYAAAGLAVLPLKPDKTPFTAHGVMDATKDEATISKWWTQWPAANIGIATGQASGGICVIDQDEKNGEHGIDTFNKWVDDNSLYIDDTWESETASGGRHTFFKSTIPVRTRVGWLDGVDIRGDGGYVVAPPSVLADGSCYKWLASPSDLSQPISNEDDEDVEFIISEINKKSGNGTPLVMPETIVTGGRNDMLYKFACSLQAKGTSDSAILAAVQAENLAKCSPPLNDDEVQKLVRSALTKEKGVLEKPEEKTESKQRDFSQVKLVKASDVLKMELPKLNVLVGVDEDVPFLVEGTCILSSKSKMGKSWFALNMCAAISSGHDLFGYKTNKRGTLYIDLETVIQTQQGRLKKLEGEYGQPDDHFYLNGYDSMKVKNDKGTEDIPRLGDGLQEAIENFLIQDPTIGIIVIDIFNNVLKSRRRDVSEYDFMYENIGYLNRIAKTHHISIVIVVHSRKTVDPSDPFQDILGSTALQGATDQMIVMYKAKYNDKLTHFSVKGRTIDGLIELDAWNDNGIWRKTDNAAIVQREEEVKQSPILKGVKELMKERDTWEGRCNQFNRDCSRAGINLDLPKDKNGQEDLRPIGKIFNDPVFKDLLEKDKIEMRILGGNSSGGKSYRFNRCAPLDFEDAPLDNPFEFLEK